MILLMLAGRAHVCIAFVAITTTNLPAIFVLVRRWLRPWLPSLPQTRRSGTAAAAAAAAGPGPSPGPDTHVSDKPQKAGVSSSRSRTKSIYGSGGVLVGYVAAPFARKPTASLTPSLGRRGTAASSSSVASREPILDRVSTAQQDGARSSRSSRSSRGRSSSRSISNHRNNNSSSKNSPSRARSTSRSSRSTSLGSRVGDGAERGIRKQVDIVIVEEALKEIGLLRQRSDRALQDVERDAGQKPLPRLPDEVYKW